MADDILNKVITFISGSDDGHDDDRSILLKQLGKELPQNKYAKFYRPRQEEADPSLATYFYSLYKVIYQPRIFFKKSGIIAKLKQITLESYLDKPIMDIIKRLNPETIAERKKTAKADFPVELAGDLDALVAGFRNPRLASADNCYDLITYFSRFVSFDYFAFLKKFDHELQDGYFAPAKFVAQRGDTVMADLANFLSVLPPLEQDNDWRTVFEIFKYCNGGAALIQYDAWAGILNNLTDLKQSKILETIVRLAAKNPIWEVKPMPPPTEQLSVDWLEERASQVRRIISNIAENQRNSKITILENEVFAAPDVTRLTYYNKEKGKLLAQKDMEAYTYAPALNHLAAFIEDFITKEITDLSDLLLVRGQWTKNAASIAMSEAYHVILEIVPKITELDESLSEDGSYGPRLRSALHRIDRDHAQARYINQLVDTINEEALEIVNEVVPSFIELGKYLQPLVDDCQAKSGEHIMNWKELIQLSKTPMAQRLEEDYKKINCFIQLMYLEAKVEDEDEEEEEEEE